MSSSHNPPSDRSQGSTPRTPGQGLGQSSVPSSKRDQRPRSPSARSPFSESHTPFDAVSHKRRAASVLGANASADTAAVEGSGRPAKRKSKFNIWVVWAFVSVSTLGGIAGASAVSLLRIPNLPNCRAIFWPLASAATRLQCADAYADQGSVENLLAAIALVEALPDDHPLRSEIDERVEAWADKILHIADQTFNRGELEDAIRIARQIPTSTSAADEVSDRIERWEAIWEQAESIFQEAENHLRASNFREAFTAAIKLRSVDNEYWANERYDELTSLISRTREEVNILANAERTAQRGTVDDILAALEQVAAIPTESYVYEEAQSVLKSMSRDLLDLAETALARQDGAEAQKILAKIPDGLGLDKEIADFRTIADAYELTWPGTTAGYEAAIVRLQSISSDRPLYAKAQALKREWNWELEGLAQLNWARQVARSGSVENLRAAITEAEEIAPSNPRWDEAQSQISDWRRDIALIEDQPIIDRAKLTAVSGDRVSLQAAIAEAQKVSDNSALYDEAQDLIADWRWQVQKLDNQPILTQARQLADTGRLNEAIEVASRIPTNQAFYDEAQTAIDDWQSRQRGRQSYQQALIVAQAGSVSALAEAIALAQEVPETSSDWTLAQRAANQWSWDLLNAAETTAFQNVAEAIRIASQIPPRTDAYAEAQLRIREWQGDRATSEAINLENSID